METNLNPDREYLTVPEFASEVRASVQTVYSWRHRGRGPKAYRVGRRLLFRRADVQEWLAQQADR